MATTTPLQQALRQFLTDETLIARLEPDALYDLILQDGKLEAEDKARLTDAIAAGRFDARAIGTLERIVGFYQARMRRLGRA